MSTQLIISSGVARRWAAERSLESVVTHALGRMNRAVAWDMVRHGLESRTESFVNAGLQPAIAAVEALLGSQVVVDILDAEFLGGTREATRALRELKAPPQPWTKAQAARMAKQVAEETAGAQLSVVRRIFREATSLTEAETLVRATLGLDEGRAQAVVNLYERFLANPGKVIYAGKVRIRVPQKPTKRLAELRARQYSDRLFRQRVRFIAQVTRTLARREGKRREWELAQAEGRLAVTVLRTWRTAEDERVCPICEPLDGETALVGQPYPTGLDGPPAHPLCRCTEEIA